MDWTRAIDGYCERSDPSYWAEPVNALTNFAFLIAAVVMWRRCKDAPEGRVLAYILGAIGAGSYLFHTHATVWAAILDVLPILIFTLVYIYMANRDFLGWPAWVSAVGALAYVPYSAVLQPVFEALPFFAISAQYWPLPLLIAAYGIILWRRAPTTAVWLCGNAGLLGLSLVARSLDQGLCTDWPLGTHFLWHLLNALMLGAMIETWRRHPLQSSTT
ncbi:MAG: hypothetical protein HKN18_17160 [Silicimonas sp.]|nr:hypothetical protein [Silicimonas sp.]